jgi:Ras-related protein Rab-8A
MNSDKTDYVFKILTIGESGVGKTCVLKRFTDGKFNKSHLATIGIDYKSKNINIGNKSVKLKIWDTAGQERFRNITQQYYKGADGIVLVFDVTEMTSFEKITEWMRQINANTQIDKIGLVLLGNKIDVEPRTVSTDMGTKLSQELGVKYFETSALTNVNIDEAFNYLTGDIMQKKNIDSNEKSTVGSNITITKNGGNDKNGNGQNKKGCC